MSRIPSVVIIGSGKVATHLGEALKNRNIQILQVVGHTKLSASKLAKKLICAYTIDYDKINKEADFYIVSVKDDAIASVVEKIEFQPSLIVHTSGSVGCEIFQNKFKNYGVLYPLQTFSEGRKINFEKIPLLIEANKKENLKKLEKFSLRLSKVIYPVDSEKRKAIHVAAVFVCNFVNHMYNIGANILEREGIPFEILIPLIAETADKVQHGKPKNLQTGPALRNDQRVIKSHLHYLNDLELKKIYALLSKSIYKYAQ